MSTLDQPLVDVADSVSYLGGKLVRGLANKRDEDALALLHALAAILPEAPGAAARTAAAKLGALGVPAPIWAATIGTATFVEAYAATDEFGDQDLIIASFQHRAQAPHTISLTADHNFHGLFRQAAVGVDGDEVRSRWAELSAIPLRQLSAQELADMWAAGTGMYRLYLDPPVYEEVPGVMALLESRAATLPPPREPEEPREMTDEERRSLVELFLASPQATSIQDRWATVADVVASRLVDYRVNAGDGGALRWSPIVVELCLLDWFPRKVTLDGDELDAVVDILRCWVRFSAARTDFADEHLAETLGAVDRFEPEFRAAMQDPASFGPAKAMVSQMLRDAIDLTDENAVQAWIQAFNERPFDERDDILLPSSRRRPSG